MKVLGRSARPDLTARLDALEAAADAADARLPESVVEAARTVLDRAGQRRRLSVEHTVVALAGATGSGKSSLFNAVSGMEISRVGVRRPTTAEPIACVWGTQGVAPLLDWLGVPARHQIARESVLDSGAQDDLDGLVLLDLPDHDSTVVEHRATVDRLVTMVDLFVWVLDPQKYADAALHERYLRPLSAHRAVTVVVLNQVDRLPPEAVERCVRDLEGLLAEDGLRGVPVVAASAVTGQGVGDLVELVRETVAKRRAVDERLAADVRTVAKALASASGEGEAGRVGDEARAHLVDALSDAAGVDVVADAVGRSYLGRARAATGWPLTRWLGRLRADPVRRLGLGRDVEPELVRTSLPEPTPVQRARADAAVRALGDAAAGSAPGPWRASIRAAAADSAGGRLSDALDQAVVTTDIEVARRPMWWRVIGAVQWAAFLVAAVGAVWLLGLMAASFLQFDLPSPEFGALPVPTLLLVAGVVIGIVVGAVSFAAARRGGRRRAVAVRKQLREVVGDVAGTVVIAPVEAELERYRGFRDAVGAAAADR